MDSRHRNWLSADQPQRGATSHDSPELVPYGPLALALARGAAHDVFNLLTVAQGNTDIAVRTVGDSNPSLQRLLEKSAEATARASMIADSWLRAARGDSPVRYRLDLTAFAREMATLIRGLLPDRIQIELDVSETAAAIDASRADLTQVFLNLALNARDAMTTGGRLEIRLRREESPGQGATAVLTFRDDGPGITREARRRLFDPDFSSKGSHGLGLPTVRNLVQRYGGSVEAESTAGGARFRVRLPLLNDAVDDDYS